MAFKVTGKIGSENSAGFRIGRFLLYALILGAVKQILVSRLPIYAISTGMMDDALMVRGARSLLSGGLRDWLGPYDQYTLVKGFFFPAFLALANKIGISYIGAATALYTGSCIVFIIALAGLFRTKYPLYLSYLALLFNPASFAGGVLQRVYRNSISQAQVLLILGCLFALYFRRKESIGKLLPWSIGAGLAWASMEHSREDAMWILPAALCVILITSVTFVLEARVAKTVGSAEDVRRKGRAEKSSGFAPISVLFCKIAIFCLPALVLAASHPAISYVNFRKYGLYSYNELNDSHFADAMKAIYGVKMPEEDIPYVSASRVKLEKLYEVSPALYEIREALERRMDEWTLADRNPSDREVEDGWFFWVFREAAAEMGIHDHAQKADQYYKRVAEEIREAFRLGKLEEQKVMPSALMPPWREGRMDAVLDALGQIPAYVSSYEGMEAELSPSVSNGQAGIALFEAITNNKAIYPEEEVNGVAEGQELYLEMLEKYVLRLSRITGFYQKTGTAAAAAGIATYLCLTVLVLVGVVKGRKNEWQLGTWLTLTGLLGAMLCLFGGVAYNHAASCYSITYMYLCPGYPLLIAFWTIGVGFLAERIINAHEGSDR